jgi:hypothetical protein
MHTHIYSYAQRRASSQRWDCCTSNRPIACSSACCAAAMQQQQQQQPKFVPEPPPWRKDPFVDYSTLMLLDLKCDVSKGEIRQIFKSVHCEFRGHGCTFHKTLREIIIPYKGLVLAYLCVYLYVYLSTTNYI